MIEQELPAEKTEKTDAIEPTEPIERIDPAEPMLRIEPAEPIDRIDPLDPMLSIEPAEPAEPADRREALAGRRETPLIPMPGSSPPGRPAERPCPPATTWRFNRGVSRWHGD
jgi:hypothetical protein